MDMTDIYQITLTQEVLTEKAAEILAKLFALRSTARKQGDAMRVMVFSDIINQIALLKPTIVSSENSNKGKLAEIKGQLDAFDKLADRYIPQAA